MSRAIAIWITFAVGFLLGWSVKCKKVLLSLLLTLICVIMICTCVNGAQCSRNYTYNMVMIGKVVGFEVGWCCDKCKYKVASACVNRCEYWYGSDVEAMICDNNGEYYMMNPDYVWIDEANGFNFWEHYDEIMDVVWKAIKRTENIWYWDNADTQGGWAEQVFYCEEDEMWYWK